jgi:hypothetical protein
MTADLVVTLVTASAAAYCLTALSATEARRFGGSTPLICRASLAGARPLGSCDLTIGRCAGRACDGRSLSVSLSASPPVAEREEGSGVHADYPVYSPAVAAPAALSP